MFDLIEFIGYVIGVSYMIHVILEISMEHSVILTFIFVVLWCINSNLRGFNNRHI
jgi:hypothetical protein